MPASSRPGSASQQFWQWLLSACAIALGSFQLAHKDLWVDEAASAGFALGGPSSWIADHNMALYYMLLSAWRRVFGISEIALRAPSVLCFALSVPLVYQIARRSFGERCARIAGALHVGNAFLLEFAQEARGYMLMLALVLCAQLALLRLLERPAWRWSVLYGVSLGLACYAHMFAVLTLLAHAVVLAPRLRRELFGALGLAAVISLPLFVQVASVTTEQVSWIRPITLQSLLFLPVIWTGGGALLGVLTCSLFAWFARGVWASDEVRIHTQLCVASVLAPLLAAIAASLWVAPMLLPKYLIGVVPALQLGAAAALAQLPRRWGRALGAVMLPLSVLRIHAWYTEQQKERWRDAVQYLNEHRQPTEPLIADLPCPEPFDYYLTRRHLDKLWAAPRWPVRAWAFPIPNELPVARDLVLEQLSRELPERIWLIDNRSARAPDLGALAAHYRVSSETRLAARGDTSDPLFGAQGALLIRVRSLARF
ncbi:MAG TPA: glycosyltransferase family 39 protein [Polyangiales bacterium]|nr:glycosyltransferase family 39 protein [Polyangiales bacterium]